MGSNRVKLTNLNVKMDWFVYGYENIVVSLEYDCLPVREMCIQVHTGYAESLRLRYFYLDLTIWKPTFILQGFFGRIKICMQFECF